MRRRRVRPRAPRLLRFGYGSLKPFQSAKASVLEEVGKLRKEVERLEGGACPYCGKRVGKDKLADRPDF